jgi:hypothetical protein
MRTSVNALDLEAGSCLGERAHMSFRDARDKVAPSRNHTGENIEPYQCPYRLRFHMGHPKSKATRTACGGCKDDVQLIIGYAQEECQS